MHFSPKILLNGDRYHKIRIKGDFMHVYYNGAFSSAFKTEQVETLETVRIGGIAVGNVNDQVIDHEYREFLGKETLNLL